jgi:hypothetical protein
MRSPATSVDFFTHNTSDPVWLPEKIFYFNHPDLHNVFTFLMEVSEQYSGT